MNIVTFLLVDVFVQTPWYIFHLLSQFFSQVMPECGQLFHLNTSSDIVLQ